LSGSVCEPVQPEELLELPLVEALPEDEPLLELPVEVEAPDELELVEVELWEEAVPVLPLDEVVWLVELPLPEVPLLLPLDESGTVVPLALQAPPSHGKRSCSPAGLNGQAARNATRAIGR
jgi:hypothetical protein